MVLFGSLTFSHISSFLIVLKRLDVHVYIHIYIHLFKAFKNKDKYIQRMLRKGSLRGWPYVKNSPQKNCKNNYVSTVSVKIAGTLFCPLAFAMLVYKIW